MSTPQPFKARERLTVDLSAARSEFRSYSDSIEDASAGAAPDRNLSPGYYLVLLRLHERRNRRRWCQHVFGAGE